VIAGEPGEDDQRSAPHDEVLEGILVEGVTVACLLGLGQQERDRCARGSIDRLSGGTT
jgi:hypothetical protein